MDKSNYHKRLVERIVNDNDRIAFDQFYALFYEKLVWYALKITGDRACSEDIVSDLFLTFLQKKDMFLKVTKVESYLYYSVRNEAIKAVKRLNQKIEGDLFSIPDDNTTPFTILEFNELCDTMDQGISKLPPQQQLVFKLIREEGLKYKEVALKLSISVKTIENHMTKAIASLRQVLKNSLEDVDTEKSYSNTSITTLLNQIVLISLN